MDSLTQIVLGAAVGEATLGRKVGNRAMLWGGICGTLPDLDVLANAVSDPMSALAYHRAFTHSLPFAALAAPIIGLALHRLYGGREGPLGGWVIWPALALAFYLLLTGGSLLMPIEIYRIPVITLLITVVFSGSFLIVGGIRWVRNFPDTARNTGWRGWSLLVFAAVVTHPLLDCFTAYGTQLLQPFVKTRVAWNTISVADPLYTLPFLTCLILARTHHESQEERSGGYLDRSKRKRRKLNTIGIILSSAYLSMTVINYFNVRQVMDVTLEREGIAVEDRVVSPSILNNVLWSGTARTEGGRYYFSQYSLFDRQRTFAPFTVIEGNHEWIAPYLDDRDVRILRWFTQDFYGVIPARAAGCVQVNDLRYGLIADDPTDPNSYIFSWQLDTTVSPAVVTREFAGPREGLDAADWLSDLWVRIKGR